MENTTDIISTLSRINNAGLKDLRTANPLVLAYIGDTIHDLFIRTYLVQNFDCSVHALHIKAIQFVRCHEQSDTVLYIMDKLNASEQAVFRRGRNAKSGTAPKNADIAEYHNATGFEAVLGYLYLSGQNDRLMEIMTMCLNYYHEKTKSGVE